MILYKPFLKDTLLYTISKIVPGISGLASVVLFIRLIGVEEYGNYSFFLSQCYLIVAIGFGWLNQSQLRYYNKDKKLDEYIPGQIRAFTYSSIISFIILCVLITTQNFSLKLLVISFISILGIAGFNFLKILYQAKLLPKKVVWLTLSQSLMGLIIPLGLLIIFKRDANTILIGLGFSFLMIVSLYLVKEKRYEKLFINFTSNGKELVKRWFSFGGPLSIWFAVGLALPFLDRFFINRYLTNEELGIYASVQEILTKLFSLIIFPITMAIHPRIMNLWNKSKKNEAIQIIKWGLGIMSFFAVIIFIFFWYFDTFIFIIINKLIPDFQIQNKNIIIPLISAGFLWQVSFLTHKMLELNDKTRLMVLFILISLSINIVGNNYFVSQYGIIASSITAFFSALVYCLLTGSYSIYTIIRLKYYS